MIDLPETTLERYAIARRIVQDGRAAARAFGHEGPGIRLRADQIAVAEALPREFTAAMAFEWAEITIPGHALVLH